MAKSKKPREQPYISLMEATRFCQYSQEYLSLRARQGKLKAVKFGRNWVTTREWLQDYIEGVNSYKQQLEKLKQRKIGVEAAVRQRFKEIEPPGDLPVEKSALEKLILAVQLFLSKPLSLPKFNLSSLVLSGVVPQRVLARVVITGAILLIFGTGMFLGREMGPEIWQVVGPTFQIGFDDLSYKTELNLKKGLEEVSVRGEALTEGFREVTASLVLGGVIVKDALSQAAFGAESFLIKLSQRTARGMEQGIGKSFAVVEVLAKALDQIALSLVRGFVVTAYENSIFLQRNLSTLKEGGVLVKEETVLLAQELSKEIRQEIQVITLLGHSKVWRVSFMLFKEYGEYAATLGSFSKERAEFVWQEIERSTLRRARLAFRAVTTPFWQTRQAISAMGEDLREGFEGVLISLKLAKAEIRVLPQTALVSLQAIPRGILEPAWQRFVVKPTRHQFLRKGEGVREVAVLISGGAGEAAEKIVGIFQETVQDFRSYFGRLAQEVKGLADEVAVIIKEAGSFSSQRFGEPEGKLVREDLPRAGKEGLVVIPSSERDEGIKKKVKEVFSDEVRVEPKDEESGIIVPVFREREGERYLYIMVPIRE